MALTEPPAGEHHTGDDLKGTLLACSHGILCPWWGARILTAVRAVGACTTSSRTTTSVTSATAPAAAAALIAELV